MPLPYPLPGFVRRTKRAADALHARSAEIVGLAQHLEDLTKNTPAWYAGTRAKVEARVALEQATKDLSE